VLDGEGNVLYEGDRAALCRCGGSANKPFCDGTHKTNGFAG
jgi:CDGSH-type Zn-finger protein